MIKKFLEKLYIALMLGNTNMKYWNDEAKEWLGKDAAAMMLTDSKRHIAIAMKMEKLGRADIDKDGIWYDVDELGMHYALVSDEPNMYTDG